MTAKQVLSLHGIRRMLEGLIPPAMCSVSIDGTPHVNFLSHAEYVDPDHIALSYQFFNASRRNVLATRRIALAVDDPLTGLGVVMQLEYERTDADGPVFERIKAKLAGIAAHTGMEHAFRLKGADVYRVLEIEQVDESAGMPALSPRCDLAAGTRAVAERLADCRHLADLLDELVGGLRRQLRIDYSIVWMMNESRDGLFALASHGYDRSGIGAELPLQAAGLVGVCVREGVPIRIGHMSQMYRYGLAARGRVEELGMQEVLQREIPLPGLQSPRSQLAVPLRAMGRTIGALLVESDVDQFFSYDDEDALLVLCGQTAQALITLQAAEFAEGAVPRPTQSASGDGGSPPGPPLRIRYFARDQSVFIDDAYLTKGVAGAILWKVVSDLVHRGRDEFTTRELRLAGGELRLPEVQDNLGVRLLMLGRRLDDRKCGMWIERTGRGRFRLRSSRPVELA
jgi:adenylate cyclase